MTLLIQAFRESGTPFLSPEYRELKEYIEILMEKAENGRSFSRSRYAESSRTNMLFL